MSYVVRVPSINAPEKTVTMLDPENDLSELIGAYLGNDAKRIFENILDAKSREYDEIDDAHYELIADGYRRELVDTMNALREALDDPKLNRKKIFNIYKNLYNNL